MLRSIITLILLGVSLSSVAAVEIIAHRGASKDAPENTLAAFRLGWEQQADANELDLYLTRDGRPVVIHDATTRRTTGVFGYVNELRLAELKAFDAGSWKDEQFAGEPIPSLDEALALTPAGKRWLIEIKCGVEVLPTLKQTVEATGKPPEQFALIAFNYETLRAAKQLMPQLKTYWVVGASKSKTTGLPPALDDLVRRATAAGFTGLDLDYRFQLTAEQVANIKRAGLEVLTWTVNDLAVAKALVAAGVDGITTDRPLWLREGLNAAPAR
ncbi:MAG: glycerophosphodiester phosphodiesterase [Planctomycetaceae bacterium]|nr:glycerophosphodiester phosphodiesterase [Planctomycetaceae bacterium]